MLMRLGFQFRHKNIAGIARGDPSSICGAKTEVPHFGNQCLAYKVTRATWISEAPDKIFQINIKWIGNLQVQSFSIKTLL